MNRGVLVGVIIFAIVAVGIIIVLFFVGNLAMDSNRVIGNNSENGNSGDTEIESQPSQARRFSVEIGEIGAYPSELELSAGDTIVFSNFGESDVWIISEDYGFDTGAVQSGQTAEVIVEKAGTWNFYDKLNPASKGMFFVN